MRTLTQQLSVAPGRSSVAQACHLLTHVLLGDFALPPEEAGTLASHFQLAVSQEKFVLSALKGNLKLQGLVWLLSMQSYEILALLLNLSFVNTALYGRYSPATLETIALSFYVCVRVGSREGEGCLLAEFGTQGLFVDKDF